MSLKPLPTYGLFPPGSYDQEFPDFLQQQKIARLLAQSLRRLTSQQRQDLQRHFYEGLSRKEIAKARGVSHQAVDESIRVSLAKLQNMLRGLEERP